MTKHGKVQSGPEGAPSDLDLWLCQNRIQEVQHHTLSDGQELDPPLVTLVPRPAQRPRTVFLEEFRKRAVRCGGVWMPNEETRGRVRMARLVEECSAAPSLWSRIKRALGW